MWHRGSRSTGVFALLLFLCGALSAPGRAQVGEAESPIADKRILNTITNLPETRLPLPHSLATRDDLYLTIDAGVAYTTIRALATPEVDPKQLAQTLETAAKGTSLAGRPIEYRHDDGYSSARLAVSEGSIGKRSGHSDVPIGRIIAGFKQAGYRPHALLMIPRYATATITDFPLHEGKRFFVYDATNAAPDQSVTVQATMQAQSIAITMVMALFVPIIGIGSLLAAIIYGSLRGVPLERRRRLYPKIASWPTFGAIALHMPFFLMFLRSPHPRIVSDLWFGSQSLTGPFFPFVASGPVVMLLLLPFASLVERRIFARTPGFACALPPLMTTQEER